MEMLEIELKIELNKKSEENLSRYVIHRGITGREVKEEDYYLDRDFELAKGDRALRIRLTETDDRKKMELTYKGAKLSSKVKSRREITIRLEEGNIATIINFFEQLGYRSVGIVKKSRTYWNIEKNGWKFLVSFDQVENLGTFLEIETSSEMEEREEAERRVSELLVPLIGEEAKRSKPILQSYLELVLAKNGNLPNF